MNKLKMLVENYQPSRQTISLVKNTRLVFLTGISGAGKNTIKRHLLKNNANFQDIVSHTTRLPRCNNGVPEREGVEYYFVDKDAVENMLQEKSFVEAKFVHGTVYGTSAKEIQSAFNSEKVAITDIDVQGVAEFKQLATEAISIFIVPPSYDIWLQRLKSRYSTEEDFELDWKKRRSSSISELEHALDVPYYHFIINDDLDRSVRVSQDIISRKDVFYEKDNEARIRVKRLLSDIKKQKTQ